MKSKKTYAFTIFGLTVVSIIIYYNLNTVPVVKAISNGITSNELVKKSGDTEDVGFDGEAVEFEKKIERPLIALIDDANQNPYLRLPKEPTKQNLENASIQKGAIGSGFLISKEFSDFLGIEEYQAKEIAEYLKEVQSKVHLYQKSSAVFLEGDDGAITIYVRSPDYYEEFSASMKENLINNVSLTIGKEKTDQFFKLQSKKLLLELGYFGERDHQIDVLQKGRDGDFLVYETFTTEDGSERRVGYGIKPDKLSARFQHIENFASRLEQIN